MSRLRTVWLHTGTNLGDRKENLERAAHLINERVGEIVCQSSLYETEAWGVENQPDYYNQALKVETEKGPFEVLETLHSIEHELGRIRKIKWGSRIIDIDLLFYGNWIIKTEKLTVPHPRIQKRNFVLIPVTEISEDLVHPIFQKNMKTLLLDSNDVCEVRKVE